MISSRVSPTAQGVPLSNNLLHDYQCWDINMDSGPVSTFQIHEHLRPRGFQVLTGKRNRMLGVAADEVRVATGQSPPSGDNNWRRPIIISHYAHRKKIAARRAINWPAPSHSRLVMQEIECEPTYLL